MIYIRWAVFLLYSSAFDTFVPLLIANSRPYLWSVALSGVLFAACVASDWQELRKSLELRGKVHRRQLFHPHVVTFFWLCLIFFLYDPTLKPKLARIGLGSVWILSLAIFFCWLFNSPWWRARRMTNGPRR